MATSNAALEIISSANLSPTEHLLLKHFVEKAVDPDLAAHYLMSRVQRDVDAEVEDCLRSFKQDWRKLASRLTSFDPIPTHLDSLARRRDGPSCCMSKERLKKGTSVGPIESAYVIPPSMTRNLASDESSLFEILEAFLTPQYVSRLQSLLENPSDPQTALQNLWCLSPSIHRVFRQGHVEVLDKAARMAEIGYPIDEGWLEKHHNEYILQTLYPEPPLNLFYADGKDVESITGFFKLSTPDPTLSLPSGFLIEVHSRFAEALHLFYIEAIVALGWPKPERNLTPPFIRQAFYYLSRLIPLPIRMRFYLLLWRIGRRRWGPTGAFWVQRLPFGLIMKECIRAPQSEPNALILVEKYTTIPAPRLVDVGEHDGKTYLIMTRLPGQELDMVMHLMSYAERDRFADDLANCVSQLRKIPNHTPYLFGNTVGGPMGDHRLPDEKGGPFNREADFNNHLTSHLGCTPDKVLGGLTMREDHRSYFTHSDFHPSNLLVEGGRLSGIVDWECTGYMPEYWEYIKAKRAAHCKPILEAIFGRAFGPVYEQEWEIERKLWRLTPFGV